MNDSGDQRRLSAILAADVVGYTRLMEHDTDGTVAAWKSARTDIIDPAISQHDGRIVKHTGDGFLAEFSSVQGAVECAVAMQSSLSACPLDFRMGINLGDIIDDGEDIHGEGINIAARIEALAEQGSICIAGSVFDAVRNRIDVQFEDMGEHTVKHVSAPVHVYQIAVERHSDPAKVAFDPSLPDKLSIAVLPFTNISGDPEQEYFTDGITEDIITALSYFKELSVISRNSTFVFKGKAAAVKAIRKQLKVDYVVEGSIRKSGNRVRITAQLIDARNDSHIWADRYDRELADIFEVQDDVVRRIAGTLVGRLEHGQQERTKRQSISRLPAYDLYLRAREHFFNWSIEENLQARDLLESAIKIEPDYAAALALYSEVLLRMWLNGWSDHPEEDLAESFIAAKKADELDDQDSRTQMSLGMAYLFQRKFEKAKHHFESAFKLNPNDARVLVYYSRLAVFEGGTERAVELCHQATSMNPYGKYNWNLGIAYFAAHRYREAIEVLEAMRNPPEAVLAILAASFAMNKDDTKASLTNARFFEAAKESPHLSKLTKNEDWRDYFSLRWPFRNREDLKHLLEALGNAGFPV